MDEAAAPAPEGPRVLADGSVVVPARLTATTFTALMHYIADQTQKSGGALSPEARTLLRALNAGAQAPGTACGTPSVDSGTVDHERHGHVLGVAEAAGLLGCTPSFVRRLCRTGVLRAQRIKGGWVIEASALDDHRFGRQAHGKPRPTPTT